jgi:hypothetical protein
MEFLKGRLARGIEAATARAMVIVAGTMKPRATTRIALQSRRLLSGSGSATMTSRPW